MATQYRFNRRTGEYRDAKTGKVVAPERISRWIVTATESAETNLKRIAASLKSGKINIAEWTIQSAAEITNMHRAVTMAAAGGKNAMTLSDWGFVGSRLRSEISYLNRFSSEIENLPEGATLTDAFIERAGSYAQSGFATYEQAVNRRVVRDGTADEEANILEPGAQHCDGCLEATAEGRVPVGTLVPIGERECGSRCRCRIDYFSTEALVSVA